MQHSLSRIKGEWQTQEIQVLLEACERRHPLRVYLPGYHLTGNAEAIYTSLIGFDLDNSELLLDTLLPFSFYELVVLAEHNGPLTLAITVAETTWFVECTFKSIDSSQAHYLVSVSVQNMRKTSSRRLHPRIHFAERQRPLAYLNQPWKPRLRAELLDLSPLGCQLRVLGRDIRSQFANRASQLSLHFNEEFQLNCQCEVKQLIFLRKPYCHNKLRLMFKQLEPVQTEQLQTFVQSFAFDYAA